MLCRQEIQEKLVLLGALLNLLPREPVSSSWSELVDAHTRVERRAAPMMVEARFTIRDHLDLVGVNMGRFDEGCW
jgi:hypothetical protein